MGVAGAGPIAGKLNVDLMRRMAHTGLAMNEAIINPTSTDQALTLAFAAIIAAFGALISLIVNMP